MEVYLARIQTDNRPLIVGIFDDLEAAKAACEEWAAKQGNVWDREWEVVHIQAGGDGMLHQREIAIGKTAFVCNYTLNDVEAW